MLKKMAIAALAVVAGLFVLNTTIVGSYTKTALRKARSAANNQVPLEFKIETLRNEISRLIPDMKKNLGAIADEIVAVDTLKEEVAGIRSHLATQKENLRAMAEALKSGDARVSYNGYTYRADRLQAKLDLALESCKQCEKELAMKEKLLDARQEKLDMDRHQLTSMRSQKEALEVRLAQLEAELKTLRVAQTRSQFQLDDSRLGKIKGALADLEKQLKVERTKNDLMGAFEAEITSIEKQPKSPDQVIKDVESYLGDSVKSNSTITRK
jgi:chromosome segregation ATPase